MAGGGTFINGGSSTAAVLGTYSDTLHHHVLENEYLFSDCLAEPGNDRETPESRKKNKKRKLINKLKKEKKVGDCACMQFVAQLQHSRYFPIHPLFTNNRHQLDRALL